MKASEVWSLVRLGLAVAAIAVVVVVTAFAVSLAPRPEPRRCIGPVQRLFLNCQR